MSDPIQALAESSAWNDKHQKRIAKLEAQLTEARAVLKLVEWSGEGDFREESCCPVCGSAPEKGHWPDCRLAKMLSRLKRALRDGGNPDIGEIMGGPIGGRLFPR